METMRKPFQGVTNIILFNWPFYAFAVATILLLFIFNQFILPSFKIYLVLLNCLIAFAILSSIITSYYVYDLSNLYSLNWLSANNFKCTASILNINAGFDETSILLQKKFPGSSLQVFDFYNPEKHTEPSIKRARKAYPPYAGTITIDTFHIPVADNSVDIVFLIFAAHEIRNDEERIHFFIEIERTLKDTGRIIVVEHIKDLPNFLAYNVGFFHFLSNESWKRTFSHSGLNIAKKVKLNPFITSYTLTKNGITS